MLVELRASRLPLLTKCSGSAYIPGEDAPSENRDRANEWGHMAHKWKETGEIHGPDKRTETAFLRAISESGISRDEYWPAGGFHEQPISIRVDGTRSVLPYKLEGQEAVGWVTGTDDFHWFMLDGVLWIDDLKTGKWYEDPETGGNRFPQDVRSTQLKAYALGISQLLSYTGVVCVSLTHWPRLPVSARHSLPVRYWTEYHTDELLEFWNELEELYQRIQAGLAGDFTLSPGDHCRFCPARRSCFVAQEPEPFQFRKY